MKLGGIAITLALTACLGCSPEPAPRQVEAAALADPVLMAAGDIACAPSNPDNDPCQDELTARLVETQNPTKVLDLGDLQYEEGRLADFRDVYADSWGRFRSITAPVVGNHEYRTANAQGYRDYWNNRGGDDLAYTFELGAWQIYVLNSNCSKVSCSEQAAWLRRHQADHPHKCVLAAFHHAYFGISEDHQPVAATKAFWDALYQYKADVILNGHDHGSAVWWKLTPSGVHSDRGLKEFIAGGGGKNSYPMREPKDSRIEGRFNDVPAVLRLDLHPTGYDYRFVTPEGDRFADSRPCT